MLKVFSSKGNFLGFWFYLPHFFVSSFLTYCAFLVPFISKKAQLSKVMEYKIILYCIISVFYVFYKWTLLVRKIKQSVSIYSLIFFKSKFIKPNAFLHLNQYSVRMLFIINNRVQWNESKCGQKLYLTYEYEQPCFVIKWCFTFK